MLVIPEEHWAKALKLLYAEKVDWSRLVYDITYTSICLLYTSRCV